jgi:DNA-binding ferritin-like protein
VTTTLDEIGSKLDAQAETLNEHGSTLNILSAAVETNTAQTEKLTDSISGENGLRQKLTQVETRLEERTKPVKLATSNSDYPTPAKIKRAIKNGDDRFTWALLVKLLITVLGVGGTVIAAILAYKAG